MNGFLYNIELDEVLNHCVLGNERQSIMDEEHNGLAEGHYQVDTTTRKNQQYRLWWPIIHKYCQNFVSKCNKCQRMG